MKDMANILIITILISLAIIVLALIGAFTHTLWGLLAGLILFIGSIGGSILSKKAADKTSSTNDNTDKMTLPPKTGQFTS